MSAMSLMANHLLGKENRNEKRYLASSVWLSVDLFLLFSLRGHGIWKK